MLIPFYPILLILLLTLALLSYVQLRRKYRLSNLPPGPSYAAPLFGHLYLLGSHPHKKLLAWKQEYGSLFPIQFGSFPAVVLNDLGTIKEALAIPSLNGKPHINFLNAMLKDRAGMSYSDSTEALHSRTFLKKSLREYAFTKEKAESGILDLIPGLLEKLQEASESGSGLLEVKHFFGFSVISYMWGVVFGSDPLEEEERVKKLADTSAVMAQFPVPVMMGMFLPKLAKMLPRLFGHEKKLKEIEEGFQGFVSELVEEHKVTRIPGHPRDLLDSFLDFYKGSNKWHVPISILELIGASVETVSSSLEWSILYLVKDPGTQRKIVEEIQTQVGMEALPSLSHRGSMPYTEAFLLEILRKASLLPLAVFHSALEDTEFRGSVIPEGTLILPNLYGANHDPQAWVEPGSFRPERFLDENGGGGLIRGDEVITFGTGKRKCLGEGFARNQLFLFLVSILQKFEFQGELEQGVENGAFGVTLAPQPFSVLVRSRN